MFVIRRIATTSSFTEYFCPKKQMFVHHSKGHRYGTRAMAQKSLNAALAKNPALAALNPEIVPVL
ncbi:MAG: hypothetical protein ACKPCM_15325 [Pseudanabaena sp.]